MRCTWDRDKQEWNYHSLVSPSGCGVAIRQAAFGEGAERIVFHLSEVCQVPGKKGSAGLRMVGPKLVAKERRFVGYKTDKLKFHEVFCTTQNAAGKIAHVFNQRVDTVLATKYPEFEK